MGDSEITTFPRLLSNGGNHCVIYTMQAEGPYPIHGAYWGGKAAGWIVTQWDRYGRRNGTMSSGLDISNTIGTGVLDAILRVAEEAKQKENE